MIRSLPALYRPLLVPGLAGVLVVAAAGSAAAAPAAGRGERPVRVSVSSAEHQGNGASSGPSVSADGRFVVFTSAASNLVRGDTNGALDVFVRDRRTGSTQRVSVSGTGAQADRGSGAGRLAVSATGRFVVFDSGASNLVPEATGFQEAVYVRDLRAGTTRRVSVATDGTASREAFGGTISADGRYVAFVSDDNTFEPGTAGGTNIFLRDLAAETTTQVNVSSTGGQPNFEVGSGIAVSAGGRYVVFASPATNIVPGDDNDSDVFRRDMTVGRTILVSRNSAGVQSDGSSETPTMTPDGRYVAFVSTASNLAPGGTGNHYEVYLRDLRTGTTSWVSTRRDGGQGNSENYLQSISADGRYVAVTSDSSDLVPGDTNSARDVFVRDRRTGSLRRADGTGTGSQADADSTDAAISADGTRIAFTSLADNLAPGDTNRVADVFLRPLAR